MANTIKAIIFDFWGTLFDEIIYPSLLRQTKYFLGLKEMDFSEFIQKFSKVVMLKKFKDKNEAFLEVCKSFDVKSSDYMMDKLIGLWNKVTLIAKPYDDTLDVLKQLKKNYKIALISNNTSFSFEPVFEKFKITDYFDYVFLSYEHGMLKSNEALTNIIKKLKVKKEEVVLVGDSIESDMKAAENFGIKGILIDRRNKREFEPKIRSLFELEDHLK